MPATSRAADQTILGNKLTVQDKSTPDKRKVKLSAKDHHANALGHRVIAEQLFQVLHDRPDTRPPWARLK